MSQSITQWGDFTGRRAQQIQRAKVENEGARRNTINAVTSGERTQVVQVPSGRAYLLPVEAVAQVEAEVTARLEQKYRKMYANRIIDVN